MPVNHKPQIAISILQNTGYMVYTALTPPNMHTALAKSTDGGKTWRFIKYINLGNEAVFNLNGNEIQGAWRYEVATIVYDPDDKVSAASIWSLSQIGGVGIQEAFEELYDELVDDQKLEYLELAMDNLSFTDGMTLRPFLDISDLDDSDLSDIYDGSDGDNF